MDIAMAYLTFFLVLVTVSICNSENGYLIDLPKCKIPYIEVFSDEAKQYLKPIDYKNCTDRELLTWIDDNKHLRVREDLITLYVDDAKNLECCFSIVTRQTTGDPDNGVQISDCTVFSYTESIPMDNDPVMVKCTDTAKKAKIVYENVHSSIVITEDVKERFKRIPPTAKPISVLFVVLDSVSRLNLIRTMNNTYAYLKDNEFIEMTGYSKMDDNTFPNFMALLAGFNLDQSHEHCNSTAVDGFDKCPMIWYDYRDLGYATAYAEDYFDITTFNYDGLHGFQQFPTDYYFRAYIGAAEKLKIQHIADDSGPYCAGPETEGERILNNAKDFALTFKGMPSFGIFWMNTFSHNELNLPFSMDMKVKEFFEDIKSNGIFDESIVVFLADHGMRFGGIRATKTGWFEERLPMNLISIPKWFRNEFPDEYEALLFNADKFTNTFDFHMTLQHILTLSGFNNYTIKPSEGCPDCQSWFERVPVDRDCNISGVAPEWCTCVGALNDTSVDDAYVKNATELVMKTLNEMGREDNENCAEMSLSEVLSVSISEVVDYTDNRTIYMNVETDPKSTYLVTVVFEDIVTEETTGTIHVHNWAGCLKQNRLEP